MKNLSLFGLLFLVLFFFFSCTSVNKVPYIYTNNINTEFEILGEIFIESKERVGYIELLNAARNLYPECHFVIDIMMDQIIINKTSLFRRTPEITDIIWRMRGTAIKYKNINNFASLEINEPFHIIANMERFQPSVQTRPNINTRTSFTEIADNYTVVSVSGNVQRSTGGGLVDINVGDILDKNTFIRTASNASLVLTDGNRNISIPANSAHRIEHIIEILYRR